MIRVKQVRCTKVYMIRVKQVRLARNHLYSLNVTAVYLPDVDLGDTGQFGFWVVSSSRISVVWVPLSLSTGQYGFQIWVEGPNIAK